MAHRAIWRSAVPVLLYGLEEDDIAFNNLLDGPTPTLDSAFGRDDDDDLADGMGVPCGTCARLKMRMSAGHARWFVLQERGYTVRICRYFFTFSELSDDLM